MRYSYVFLLLIVSKTFAQSSTVLLPNATKIGNVTSLGTCNSATRGTQVFNTTDSKMYFCNGAGWVDMTGGGGGGGSLTLPYSGSSATLSTLFSLTNSGSGRGISVTTGNNRAIYGNSTGSAGVYGESVSGAGLYGVSDTGVGVFGYANSDFSGFFNNKAKVGFNLAVGQLTYAQTIARLHIKADGNGGWGQHIRMENGDNTGYGEILHDVDGMKFRNFQANESFIFRNSSNTSLFSINSSGNISATGNIYADGNALISGGAGIGTSLNIGNDLFVYGDAEISGELLVEGQNVVLNNTVSPYMVLHETQGYSFTLAANTSIISTLNYPDFSGVPAVSVAQVEDGTGGWDKLLVVPYNVTAASCSLKFTNVTNSSITMTGTWHFTVIGPK